MGWVWAVVAVVGVLLIGEVVLWGVVLPRVRRRNRARAAEAAAWVAPGPGQEVPRGPERGSYRGSTGGYPKVAWDGTIELTASQLRFLKSSGREVVVELSEVVGLEVAGAWNGEYRAGHKHLIVRTTRGDVAFFVADVAAWRTAIESAVANLSDHRLGPGR